MSVQRQVMARVLNWVVGPPRRWHGYEPVRWPLRAGGTKKVFPYVERHKPAARATLGPLARLQKGLPRGSSSHWLFLA